MEVEQTQKKSFKDFLKKNSRTISILVLVLIIIASVILWIDYSQKKTRIKTSEEFIKAKLLLENDKDNQVKKALENIILQKDKIYSPLSLFLIIDKNLESNNEIILNHFNTVLEIKLEEEELNLLKLKKGIFISESAEEKTLLDLLNPVINSDSVWKNQSINLVGDYYFSKKEYSKAKQYYRRLLSNNDNAIDNNDIKRKLNIIENE